LTLGTAAALAGATGANAAPDFFEVTVTTGSGAGSLHQAILDANADPDLSTITFSPSVVSAGTITVTDGGLPEILEELTIVGPTSGPLVIAANDSNDGGIRAWGYSGDAPEFAVTVSDLTISGFYNDVDLGFVAADLDHLILEDATNVGLISYNSATMATDLTITGPGGWGVYVTDNEPDVTPVSFDGLTVTDRNYGIYYEGASDAYGAFEDATATAVAGHGVVLILSDGAHVELTGVEASAPTARGLYLLSNDASAHIIGGYFHDSLEGGVYVDAGAGSLIELDDSQISDNYGNYGAGIEAYLNDGEMQISGTVINGNQATFQGGGIYLGSLQGPDAEFGITRSTITGNSALLQGGGILLNDLGTGTPSAGVSITDSEITNNDAAIDGAGLAVFAPGPNTIGPGYPTVFVERTTIADNDAVDNGGGMYLSVYGSVGYSPVALLNSTIAGNTAGNNGGAAYVDAGVDFDAYFVSTTIAGNSSGIFAPTSSATVEILWSILANNGGNDLERDTTPIEVNWSLVETPLGTGATDDVAAGTGNLVGVDPELGTLALNGGATRTMRPALTSPAVNAGDPSLIEANLQPGGDQRGGTRLVAILDLGAVELTTLELNPAALAATGVSPAVPVTAVVLLLVGGIALVARRKRVHA
jgi:hypothetical protein